MNCALCPPLFGSGRALAGVPAVHAPDARRIRRPRGGGSPEGRPVSEARRLRPRHVGGETEVRGRTYQRHGAEPLDARHRELHSERLRLNRLARPHLVARRQISLAASPPQIPLTLVARRAVNRKTDSDTWRTHSLNTRSSSCLLLPTAGATSSQAGASHFLGHGNEDARLNFSCGTCALVGYSGHLLGSGLGNSVDASECVIRLGRSPGRGYDQDVGSKATFRLMHADTLLTTQGTAAREAPIQQPAGIGSPSGVRHAQEATPASLRTRLESSGGPRLLSLRRSAEHAAAKSLAEHASTLGYQLSGAEPSTLWHAVKLTETIGCQSLNVFGVPEPKICKRHRNEPSRSRFWEYASPPQCLDGLDVGHNENPLRPDPGHLSLVDRRALAGWLQSAQKPVIRFLAPTWSVSQPASAAAAAT
ncbi:LOW QUALITY PROTEIN: alpha-N-acetylgalactosaminide alpha-2,6-sialyltransferase 5-like [Dermacentor silvarum]|uniref:LOW QUALITY PROTEIN: alpha-N-acetylgalactosaminide alpha-2,6-sialyltransferase 5-like n=1 Tax=Dermacentor silvarum TaxID=543639 RepID=UPI0021016F61|nr:LOW QUALITY PROTEIN: alpha-N-acetylgalactosaminide alpha-2,6-sialyltransferase 5-like [Dermacentor silvarum]